MIKDKLTALVTTHILPTAPSIEVIKTCTDSIFRNLEGIKDCKFLVYCDSRESEISQEYLSNLNSLDHVEIIDKPNSGLRMNYQDAIEKCETEYFFFCEHDWIFLRPVELEKIIDCMEKNPNVNYIKFNCRDNCSPDMRPAPAKAWETYIEEEDQIKECSLMRTNSITTHPHIIRKNKFVRDWLPLVDGHSIEVPLYRTYTHEIARNGFRETQKKWGVFNYGSKNDTQIIDHLDGNKKEYKCDDGVVKNKMIKIKHDKIYLITGASGFLGVSLTKKILSLGGRVRALSRDEGKLIELKQKFPEVEILTGDVSDSFEVHQSMNGVTGVFHLAAFKHVGMAEYQARECTKTNVIGSLNVLEEAVSENVDFILGISTDKAAQVSGIYGASKLIMEKIFKQYEKNNPDINFRIVRYGNVLYSTGSVLCKWKASIQRGEKIIITAPEATRYFWSIDQAIDLIFDCMTDAINSEPYCPAMKSMKLADLLQAMIEKYSNGQNIEVETIGLQPGENLHERVLEEGLYSNEAERFTTEEIKAVI